MAAAPRSARVAVAAFFALAGIAFGSWVSRIPEVKAKLGLDPGQLGLALLGMAVGAVIAMPTTGWLIARWGSRRVCGTAGILACLTLLLPVLAPSGPLLFVALMLFGSAYGVMDVSMNTQAAAVEALYARPIMSSFHGVFSVGGLVGAATAGLITGLGVAPVPHLAAVAAVSPPIELAQCVDALERLENAAYHWNFLRGLRGRMRRKIALYPAQYDPSPLTRVRTVRQFDHLYTAPHNGFDGASDYYHRASARRVLDRLAVPALLVTAMDDPFVPPDAAADPALASMPRLTRVITRHGGHCGYVGRRAGDGDDGYWAERAAIDFVVEHAVR